MSAWRYGGRVAVTLAAASTVFWGCGSGSANTPGVATHLVITTQPSVIRAEDPLGVQPVLEVRDDDEHLVSTGSYLVGVTSTAGSVVYSDTRSSAGIVRFTDLHVGAPENTRLTFSATGLRSALSDPMR